MYKQLLMPSTNQTTWYQQILRSRRKDLFRVFNPILKEGEDESKKIDIKPHHAERLYGVEELVTIY